MKWAPYSTPQGKCYQQRLQARQRGVDWELSFAEWWSIWQESGKWGQRGPRPGQYVMARRGDAGPYSKDNVLICSSTDNRKQAYENGRCDQFQALGKGRGFSYKPGRSKPYEVYVACKYLGAFETQQEAKSAYAEGVMRRRAGVYPAICSPALEA